MKRFMLVFTVTLVSTTTAHADERAVYVGEGRYACSEDSADCAVLKQRNEEQTRRARDRNDYEQRSDLAERHEREYLRDYESDRY